MGRLLRGRCGLKAGLERWRMGFAVHSGGPQQVFMGALDLGLGLGLELGLGLRLDVGLGLRLSLLLLLQEDLVVQKLELGWVPVDRGQTKIKELPKNDTIHGEHERALLS